jgi:transglutaminase-like putative cysteine protease
MHLLCCLIATTLCWQADNAIASKPPRKFELDYGATITDLPDNANVKVWFPIPKSNALQRVKNSMTNTPSPLKQSVDEEYGNSIGYFEISGKKEVSFLTNYEIERKEATPGALPEKLTPQQKHAYLAANRLVPTTGEPIKLLDGKNIDEKPMSAGQQLYEIVETYMTYDKSKPGYGNGDVMWACSSKTGNCTDFHSLFISLARNRNIPARFEIGFPIGKNTAGKIGGYHCWAWFHTDEKGWIAVDISEADKHPEMKRYYFGRLTPDRVAFSTGRDIQLVPKSKSGPLNYFVYPHVEVDGKVWPKDKIKLELSYKDIK